MSELILSRWQFGITSTYHFLFVPLTLGLSVLVALMEVAYVRTGRGLYKEMAKFWGKLFVLNFAMGVVTGIVQEFHFGMNWSEYSRFMGDIFGAPLALEALTAFFLESTFLGLWIFGWDRLSPKLHAATMCVVAFASNLSAFWILVANSFMQSPTGFVLRNGRAEMTDVMALLTNPYVLHQYPHVLLSGLVTASVFVAAISAWHLLRRSHLEFFQASLKAGLICMLASSLAIGASGHLQTQHIGKVQPMKLAAVEALWDTTTHAPFSLFAAIDEAGRRNTLAVGVPGALSMLAQNDPAAEIKGINQMEKEYITKFGKADYVPPVTPLFWSFRLMTAAGGMLILLAMVSVWLWKRGTLADSRLTLNLLVYSLPLPYIANSTGWFVTEAGRQPWIVVGLQRVDQGLSSTVGSGSIWLSMIGFTVVYGILAFVAARLMRETAMKGPAGAELDASVSKGKEATLWS